MAASSASEAAVAGARALLAAESVGVLSTISVHRVGFPYGSVTPYALSVQGAPVLLLSRLAAHTKNLLADPRASLFVGDRSAAEDPQAGARISLLGRMAPLPAPDEPDARARYLKAWPRAADYLALGDFSFWRLDIEEARLIAGFGEIRWLDGAALHG
ncbi:MAG TPA: pyridoxamine 5'-phosphate oxidase family protein [Polyangia bacterium]|nr:pyridoxamine 5'-phosphate oxidase family protein [Polyangia bacterium]